MSAVARPASIAPATTAAATLTPMMSGRFAGAATVGFSPLTPVFCPPGAGRVPPTVVRSSAVTRPVSVLDSVLGVEKADVAAVEG